MKTIEKNRKPKAGLLLVASPRFKNLGEGLSRGTYGERKAADVEQIIGKLDFLDLVYPGVVYEREDAVRSMDMFYAAKVDFVIAEFLSWSEDFAWIRFLRDMPQVPVIFDSLMNALKRDVRVIAILRNGDEQFKAGLWPDPSTHKLMEAGMKIHEIPHLHAKSIFVDGKHAVIMSANFNPYSLGDTPTSHIELGLCADLNQPFASELYRFCKNLIKKAH